MVSFLSLISSSFGESPHDVVANVMDSNIVISDFKLHSDNNIRFRTVILGKFMDPLILPAMG